MISGQFPCPRTCPLARGTSPRHWSTPRVMLGTSSRAKIILPTPSRDPEDPGYKHGPFCPKDGLKLGPTHKDRHEELPSLQKKRKNITKSFIHKYCRYYSVVI